MRTKLKDKYSTVALALKKLSEIYPSELLLSQFKGLLKDLKVKYSEKDLKDYIKAYGTIQKTSVLITIKALTRSLSLSNINKNLQWDKQKKKSCLIKTHVISTRSSTKILEDTFSNLNISIPVKEDENCIVKAADETVFLDHLLEIFHCPETVTDYFFICRENGEIQFQDFLESVEKLGLIQLYDNLFSIFQKLGDNSEVIQKTNFFDKIFQVSCVVVEESWKEVQEFKSKIRKIFKNCVKAFDEISTNGKNVDVPVFEKIGKKIGMNLSKECFSGVFLDGKVGFKEFKRLWTGKEMVCKVRICEEDLSDGSLYCQGHLQMMAKRGEEIFHKLQIAMRQSQINILLQDVLKDDRNTFCVNGIEMKENDVISLREYLKLSGYCKRRVIHSVKARIKPH